MLKAPKKVINILCRGLMRSFTFFLLVASLVYGIAIYAADTGSEHSETLSNHQTLLNPISFGTILVSGNSSRSGYGPVRIYVPTRCRPRSPWKPENIGGSKYVSGSSLVSPVMTAEKEH